MQFRQYKKDFIAGRGHERLREKACECTRNCEIETDGSQSQDKWNQQGSWDHRFSGIWKQDRWVCYLFYIIGFSFLMVLLAIGFIWRWRLQPSVSLEILKLRIMNFVFLRKYFSRFFLFAMIFYLLFICLAIGFCGGELCCSQWALTQEDQLVHH